MEGVSSIKDLLDSRLVLGDKLQIDDNLSIIPVYKSKVSFLNLRTDLKDNIGDGVSGSLNVNPVCLLKIYNNNLEVINLKDDKDNILDVIPNVLSNIDFNDLFKNIKIS